MRRISSSTFFLKWVHPVILFGFLLFFMVSPWIASSMGGTTTGSPFFFVIIPAIMGIGFFYQMKTSVFDLADEVLDEGDWLVVRKGRLEDRIALADITNVNYSWFGYLSRVTLSLRKPSELGKRVSFRVRTPFGTSFGRVSQPSIVDELVERIDAKRRVAATR